MELREPLLAEPLVRAVLAAEKRTLGDGHPDTVTTALLLAEVLRSLGPDDWPEGREVVEELLRAERVRAAPTASVIAGFEALLKWPEFQPASRSQALKLIALDFTSSWPANEWRFSPDCNVGYKGAQRMAENVRAPGALAKVKAISIRNLPVGACVGIFEALPAATLLQKLDLLYLSTEEAAATALANTIRQPGALQQLVELHLPTVEFEGTIQLLTALRAHGACPTLSNLVVPNVGASPLVVQALSELLADEGALPGLQELQLTHALSDEHAVMLAERWGALGAQAQSPQTRLPGGHARAAGSPRPRAGDA
jgi:hypothetical protein